MPVNINCDMGESFGLYKMGDDEAIMPYITEANVACGFHASDPNHMRKTVELAKHHGVKVGAHFSLPDLAGFGRREMKIERSEMANIITYQIGALSGFLKSANIQLSHLKPHGALYGMAAREEHVANAICDAAEQFRVPIFGLAGTLHEEIYTARGFEFCAEFFADLDYADDGGLIITKEHPEANTVEIVEKVMRAVTEKTVVSIGGKSIPVRADTICIHSDTPGIIDAAKAIRESIASASVA